MKIGAPLSQQHTDDLIDRRQDLRSSVNKARDNLTRGVRELQAVEAEILRRVYRDRQKRGAA